MDTVLLHGRRTSAGDDYPRFGFTDAEKQSFQEIILTSFHVIEPAVE
jgi:hypothetical protein